MVFSYLKYRFLFNYIITAAKSWWIQYFPVWTMASVFCVLRDRVNFSNSLSENSGISLYDHGQNKLKPRFKIISVFRWDSCGLSKCLLNGHQGQTLKMAMTLLNLWQRTKWQIKQLFTITARHFTVQEPVTSNGKTELGFVVTTQRKISNNVTNRWLLNNADPWDW